MRTLPLGGAVPATVAMTPRDHETDGDPPQNAPKLGKGAWSTRPLA